MVSWQLYKELTQHPLHFSHLVTVTIPRKPGLFTRSSHVDTDEGFGFEWQSLSAKKHS